MKRIQSLLFGVVLSGAAVLFAAPVQDPDALLAQRVRHELVMLPYYNVFDTLSLQVENGNVTLMGQVTDPVLKSSAENVVKRLPGVTSIDNQIEVLPLSPYDYRIRFAVWRAVYSWPSMNRLVTMANPPVHIIVKNGNVTLEGVVPTQADKDALTVRVNGVPGVFSVENHLAIGD
jgi:hyperosmotically inducible protein